MKFRFLIGMCALALAASATDALTDSATYGWMKVTSNQKFTIVAVPWLGVDGENVKVADLVKTDGLTPGSDMLFVYNKSNNTYSGWSLGASGWEPLSTSTSVGGITVGVPAAGASLPQGSALWLYRPNASGSFSFYVYGRDGTAGNPTLATGYNMLACPSTTAETWDLNGTGNITGASTDDMIRVPQDSGADKVYTFKDGSWGTTTYEEQNYTDRRGNPQVKLIQTRTTTGCTIPAGTGFWYVKAAESSATIAW